MLQYLSPVHTRAIIISTPKVLPIVNHIPAPLFFGLTVVDGELEVVTLGDLVVVGWCEYVIGNIVVDGTVEVGFGVFVLNSVVLGCRDVIVISVKIPVDDGSWVVGITVFVCI